MKRVVLYKCILLGSTLGLTFSSFGQGMAYGIDAQKKLWLFDLATAASTEIGTTSITAQGLGMDPSGALYAVTSSGGLYSMNKTTAAATLIGFSGIGIMTSMDWDSDGSRMLVTNDLAPGSVYSISLTTAAVTLVKTMTSGTTPIQTLAVRPGGTIADVRVGSGIAGSFGDKHATVDLTSGTLSILSGVFSDINGMDYGSNGVLYGLTTTGRLVSIVPGTGAETDIGLVNGGIAFTGMTAVVPEPSVWIGLTLGALALRRRRR